MRQGHFARREKGLRNWEGDIFYIGSHGDSARIYFKFVPGEYKIQILAYSNKAK